MNFYFIVKFRLQDLSSIVKFNLKLINDEETQTFRKFYFVISFKLTITFLPNLNENCDNFFDYILFLSN